jgi:hypothetical protein
MTLNGGGKKCTDEFGWGKLKERGYLKGKS